MVRDASVLELWSEGPYALVSPATLRFTHELVLMTFRSVLMQWAEGGRYSRHPYSKSNH